METNMQTQIVNKLKQNNYYISTCESCTGGMLVSEIISVSGASAVISSSFITYSDCAKIKYANVKKRTLKKFGAVSREVAIEMATGIAKKSKSDVGISVTGYAGDSGDATKPAGLVWVGISINKKVEVYSHIFANMERNQVRKECTYFALKKLLLLLNEIKN